MPDTSTPGQNKTLLAADVGGTKTLLHLRALDSRGQATPIAEQRYSSGSFDSLESMIERFLSEHADTGPDSACLAVAGPVHGDSQEQNASLTNLPWQLNSRQLGEALGIPKLRLLNDFQAIGYSLDELGNDELVTLHEGQAIDGAPRLVVGAGTGLGVCTLFPDSGHYVSHASEGGHIAFAPADAQQAELLEFLQQEYGRVSYERLVSGVGLVNIYRYLLQQSPPDEPPVLTQPDPAAAIGRYAVEGGHPLAAQTVTLFSRIYGAFTGDLALVTLPAGGVYIAGGIAPKLLSCLQDGNFIEAFFDKGRMRELVQSFPVKVITNPHSGLLGAAHYAARL
jgi:glucokinase